MRDFAERFGFERDRLPAGLTLALGSGVVTLPQMAGAYAAFANGGFRVEPYLIARIEDGAGQVVFAGRSAQGLRRLLVPGQAQHPPAAAGEPGDPGTAKRVLEPRLTYQMHSMLQDVIKAGTGRRARALKRSDLAGKTGTTNDARDAWFCGYQKDLVSVAWMGFDDFSPLGSGETGGESALGLWMAFMGPALKGRPEAEVPVPSGMVQVWVDRQSGDPVNAGDSGAIGEWVREEDARYLAGPDPVPYFVPGGTPTTMAPAIIDEVF